MAKRRNSYEWKARTEDGRKRKVRAQRERNTWRIESLGPDDEDWVHHPRPSLEDLEALEEILVNKYQRKHTSFEFVDEVQRMVEAKRASLPKPDEIG